MTVSSSQPSRSISGIMTPDHRNGRSFAGQPVPEGIRRKVQEPMLEVDNVVEAGVLNDVSFQGIRRTDSGLCRSGRRRSCRDYARSIRRRSDRQRQDQDQGQGSTYQVPRQAIHHGIAFLTEDRKGQGLVLAQTIRTNLILANMKGFSSGLFLNEKRRSSRQANRTLRRCASRPVDRRDRRPAVRW